METCDMCGNRSVCGHSIALDGSRKFWRICCLCTAELIAKLGKKEESVS